MGSTRRLRIRRLCVRVAPGAPKDLLAHPHPPGEVAPDPAVGRGLIPHMSKHMRDHLCLRGSDPPRTAAGDPLACSRPKKLFQSDKIG
jgi:hypothetical protein